MEFEDLTPAGLPRCPRCGSLNEREKLKVTEMGMWIGRNRKARVTYGFDEIALVPGDVTINPNEVDISFRIPRREGEPITLNIPILASAMDGVVDVRMAVAMGELGGLGVLNLEGVQTRYENPDEVLAEVVSADKEKATTLIQKLYQEPIREDLIARRVQEIEAPALFAPSARFRRRPSALAPSPRKLAWTSLLSSRPFRLSGTFPPSIRRSISQNSALR